MKYTKLGNSDLTVSRICLGCMGFGASNAGMHTWTLGEIESREIIRYALESGINFFDTAIVYSDGTSEQFTGRALKDFADRDKVVVATKFPIISQKELESGVSGREHIENCLNTSLANLGMDYIDLYIMHMWDYNIPVYEIMETLNDAVKAGKVHAIGVSNCYAWQIAKVNALAEKEGFTKFVSVQGHYNLLHREEERDMRLFCLEDHIAMTPYSALAAGRLSRLPGESTKRFKEDAYSKFKYDSTAETDNRIVARIAELAEKKNLSMTEISLAWLLGKVTSPVCGATKKSHIDGICRAVDITLTSEEMQYLEELYVPHRFAGVMAEHLWQLQKK